MRRTNFLAFVFLLSIVVDAVGQPQSPSVRVIDIDPTRLVIEKLPIPLKTSQSRPAWNNETLAKVLEVNFGDPETHAPSAPQPQWVDGVTTINLFNTKAKDGFIRSMMENRTDLRGIPFLLGDDCRTKIDLASAFGAFAARIRQKVTEINDKKHPNSLDWAECLSEINTNYSKNGVNQRAAVAALMQIVMPESADLQVSAAKYFATISHADASRALARLSVFSFDEAVRAAAIIGLKNRPKDEYTNVLEKALNYPLPIVAQHAAEALVKLNRQDMLMKLIDVFDRQDPRLPQKEMRDGKESLFVRELAKVNHLRNCFLCHAPGNTKNVPDGVLKAVAPVPGNPLPMSYYSADGDIVVRVDTTYLRQDFSLTMTVANANPWPGRQRFDFFVRTRELTNAEANEFPRAFGSQSPYHRSALYALRELTGRDAAPTAEAWRKLLKLPRS
jgi:HEAT repeat protein